MVLDVVAARGDAAQLAADLDFLGLLSPEALAARVAERADRTAGLRGLGDRLQAERERAKAAKDFSGVDRLKAVLTAAGVVVQMGKDGVTLEPGPDFDATKLEALK